MPSLGFSGSNLATVAYAEVDGATGASTATNSGVRTTRVSLGVYVIVLPTSIAQVSGRDLIFVQPKDNAGTFVSLQPTVDDSLACTKTVRIWNPADPSATFPIDRSFSILILRTTIPPPSDGPA